MDVFSSTYTPLSSLGLPSKPVATPIPIPCDWPGTYTPQSIDHLYHVRDRCYKNKLGPNLDVWSKEAQQCRIVFDEALYQQGKNPCQRNTWTKTPVYWF